MDKMINVYRINFRKRAVKEYFESLSWYKERSLQAAENFVSSIQQALDNIENDPLQFKKTYKEFREIKVKMYPFKIIFFIDENKNSIVITSIFHQKRNPEKKF